MAGFFERTKDFFGLTPMDDFDGEYFDEYDRYEREPVQREAHAPRRYAREEYYREPARVVEKVVEPVHIVEEITLVAEEYADAVQIGKAVKRGDFVIFDVSTMDKDQAKRIIDFAAGLSFALDGHFQRRSGRVFEIATKEAFDSYTAGQRQTV